MKDVRGRPEKKGEIKKKRDEGGREEEGKNGKKKRRKKKEREGGREITNRDKTDKKLKSYFTKRSSSSF